VKYHECNKGPRLLLQSNAHGSFELILNQLAKIAMVQVLGSIEDEQCLSSSAFCKSTHYQPRFGGQNVFLKNCILHNFSHAEAFEQWCAKCP
jgi:hypothetical protein